jgi:OmpA-OmpF porin, OOP family
MNRSLLAGISALLVCMLASGVAAQSAQPRDAGDRVANPSAMQARVSGSEVTFAADVYFDVDKAVLKPEARAKLDVLVQQLRSINVQTVNVSGHTDADASDEYNEALAGRRVEVVRSYLAGRGVDAAVIQAAARGERVPAADNITALGKRWNRRVEIEVVGKRR